MHYDVVVSSFRLNAAEPPGKVLERILGLNADEAKALLRRFPAVIVSRVEQGRAEQILVLLQAAGATGALRESVVVDDPSRTGPPVRSLPAPSPTSSLRTLSLASLPPEPSPPPASAAWASPFEESPVEAEQHSEVPVGPVTAYQLGDLDFGPPPASLPPKARPAQAVPPASKPAAAQPAPSKRGAGASGTGPSSDGMQTFGDGFDDMETAAPVLELDRGNRWRGDNTVGLHKAQGSRGTMASVRAPTQERVVKPASFRDGWGESVWELFKLTVLGVTGVCVVLGIVFFIRDHEAAGELFGLSEPPPIEELTEHIMANGLRLTERRADGYRKVNWSLKSMDLPGSTSDALLHPLLRIAPKFARPFVAQQLRVFVSEVEAIDNKSLAEDALGRHVDCLLVQHDPNDLRDRDAAQRVATLLRTGHLLELPRDGEQLLINEMARRHGKRGVQLRFTPFCLAL